jgi:protein TonB
VARQRGGALALTAGAAVAAGLVFSLLLYGPEPRVPPRPDVHPTAPPPSPARSVPIAEPSISIPMPTTGPAIFGAVYEVTIPRPAPTPVELEPTALDLRKVGDRDVSAPVLVQRVEPVYPESARRARMSGQVVIEAVITDRGEVASPRVLQSTAEPLLNDEALKAVRQWRYRPATFRGKPVRVYLTVTVTFRLN